MATVFDFDERWDEVVHYLAHPTVMVALNVGMTRWCRDRGASWNPDWGPWAYSNCGYWTEKADEALTLGIWEEHLRWGADNNCLGEDDYGYMEWMSTKGLDHLEEVMAPLYPQPNTPDWYRCHGASHELAAWNCAIGELLFPDQSWRICIANEHSCAFSPEVYMDILWSHKDAATISRTVLSSSRFYYSADSHRQIVDDTESSVSSVSPLTQTTGVN